MSRRIYITFGGATYDGPTGEIVRRAPKLGADEVRVYDDAWLMRQPLFADPRFQYLFTHRGVGNPGGGRGFGWFSWKPYVIAHALRNSVRGDLVLYTDADTYPIAPLTPIYDEAAKRNGMMLFSAVGCRNSRWTKRDCLIAMGMDELRYRDCQHAVARFMVFQAGHPRADAFLAEWQEYCLDPRCQTFEPSVLAPEYPEFHEHRTEQSVFTLLAHKYRERLYREACQFGNSLNDDRDIYPQTFLQVGCYSGGPKPTSGSIYANV